MATCPTRPGWSASTSASLRPLAPAFGASAAVLGVVLGSWMTIAGVAILASQVALLTP